MDKGRPYDDLNTIVNDKEDEDMEDGEKVEGEETAPHPRQRVPHHNPTPGVALPFFPPNIPPLGINPPGMPPPGLPPYPSAHLPRIPPGLSSIFAHHPLHDTDSHENLPPNTFGPPVPAQLQRQEQGVVKQFDFRYITIIHYFSSSIYSNNWLAGTIKCLRE
jgi:hypothetical protein